MNRLDIEASAARATYLRGLSAIPLGLFFLVPLGLFSLLDAGNSGTGQWWQLAIVALLVILEVAIRHYYRTRFGVARRGRVSWRRAVPNLVFPVVFVGGLLLDMRLHADVASAPTWTRHLSATMLGFAVATLLWHRLNVGLQAHDLRLWGGLTVLAMLPVWGWGGEDSTITQSFMLFGGALVLAGLLDHRLLVASLPTQLPDPPLAVQVTP